MENIIPFYIIRIYKTPFALHLPLYKKYYQFMGSKATQSQKQPSLDDLLIEMKINAKRMNKESLKAMKDSQNYMKKAK